MGCPLAITPNKSHYEQGEMFTSYQHVHGSLSFPLMTFKRSIMLLFTHHPSLPHPVREVLLELSQI